MNPIKLGKILAVVFFMAQAAMPAVLTVAQDGTGTYESVQDAVDNAKEGDIIEILDDAVYEEQVTIDSAKTGLTLRGDINAKPTIKHQDTKATYPSVCEDAQDENKSDSVFAAGNYYEQNGAVRVIKARQVTIENIIINGDGAKPFYHSDVWKDPGCTGDGNDLFHGNAGIALVIAGDVIIRNCEIYNAYFGISVKDRNEQGVFANPNPSDISLGRIVPLAGFGKTGNHIFENNKIHNNSWGMFFESSWDLGSTIRYNLIYSNYHQTSGLVADMGTEAGNQIGGGILFKDDPLSPVAIYNNTFWDNTMCIASQWQAGAYHLIFNNIFSKPHLYIGDYGITEFSLEEIMPKRYKHNLYAARTQVPNSNSVRIDNDMAEIEKDENTYEPGAIINGGSKFTFPTDANNRWLESQEYFVSTKNSDENFLVPDWDDPIVQEFILDAGWPGAGLKDADGSIADIGAISKSGVPEVSVGTKAINPVIIDNGTATVSFNVYPIAGDLTDMKVKYVQWMGDLPRDTGWANEVNNGTKLDVNKAANIQTLSGGQAVSMGLNNLTFKVEQTGKYAFLEIVIEGIDEDGDTVTTNVGFLPYRELEYLFDVGIYETDKSTGTLKELQVGQTVYLSIKPVRVDKNKIANGTAKENEISLISPYGLEDPDGNAIKTISSITQDGIRIPVVFKKIPDQKFDAVMVNGTYYPDGGNGAGSPIMGTSDQITINPGDPAVIEFVEQSRNETFRTTINPSEVLKSKLQVYDKYGNKANKPAKVTIKSTKPKVGGPVEDAKTEGESDDTGIVYFDGIEVNPEEGSKDAKFELVATLFWSGKEADLDTAYLKVGNVTEYLQILYPEDVETGYDPLNEIDTCSGERIPVTIRSMDNGETPHVWVNTTNIEVSISFDPKDDLVAYDSETGIEPVTKVKLVNGEAKFWIQAIAMTVEDGEITVSPVGIRTITKGKRGGINFKYCDNPVVSASYIADNGNGSVSGAVVKFRDPLATEDDYPDTLVFYWPDKSVKRTVAKAGIKLSSDDKTVVTVTFDKSFDSLITSTTYTADLGECIRVNKDLGVTNSQSFKITEKVGPLVMSAIVVERPRETGDDTLYLTFSEFLGDVSALKNDGLLLVKGEKTSVLNVLNARNITADTVEVIVKNTDNALAPKEGDLLRFNPDGKVTDKGENSVHKDNRPVAIMQKEVPPSIVRASYYDKNGNGFVDTVVIELDKAVKLDALSAVITWSNNKTTGKLESSQFAYVADGKNAKVAVDVSSKFKDLGVKTSANMRLTLDYKSEQVSVTIGADVIDRAAPVIKDAVYHPGRVAASDTIHVTFSERIKNPESSSSPFLFYRGKTEYGMELKYLSVSGNTVRYLVEKITNSILIAENKDSVRIKAKVYGDDAENVQNVSDNHLAPVIVLDVPVEFTVKVGPNPFIANGQNYVTIIVDPQTKMIENIQPKGLIRIYDALGNIVCEKDIEIKNGEIKYKWDGRNMKGRFVGSGTYLAIVEATDVKSGQSMEASRHTIGVKR